MTFSCPTSNAKHGVQQPVSLPQLQLHFYGDDSEIDLQGMDPKYKIWSWMPLQQLPQNVVDAKKDMYEQVCVCLCAWLFKNPAPVSLWAHTQACLCPWIAFMDACANFTQEGTHQGLDACACVGRVAEVLCSTPCNTISDMVCSCLYPCMWTQ